MWFWLRETDTIFLETGSENKTKENNNNTDWSSITPNSLQSFLLLGFIMISIFTVGIHRGFWCIMTCFVCEQRSLGATVLFESRPAQLLTKPTWNTNSSVFLELLLTSKVNSCRVIFATNKSKRVVQATFQNVNCGENRNLTDKGILSFPAPAKFL